MSFRTFSRVFAQAGDRKSTRLKSSHAYLSLTLFFFNDPAPTEIYPLSLHDALPISRGVNGHELLRHLEDVLPDLLPGLCPGGSAEPVEFRRQALGADVFLHLVEAVERNVQLRIRLIP